MSRPDLPRMGAEYSDEITKINRREEMTLERKLRFLERQEKLSQSLYKKSRNEIEKLKSSIRDNACKSTKLSEYDRLKATDRSMRSDAVNTGQTVRFPPLSSSWNERRGSMLTGQTADANEGYLSDNDILFPRKKPGSRSKHVGTQYQRALSLRALRDPTLLKHSIGPGRQAHAH